MVNDKSKIGIEEAWRSGLTLRQALDLFSPELDRTELAKRGKAQRRASAIGKRKFREAGVNADQLLDALDTGLFRYSGAVQASESQKHQLIAALENGKLLALGFPAHRERAIRPEPVPPFLIQLQFANFRKSEFSDDHNRYAKVRIVRSNALARPKIGRPSIRNRVAEIASALAKAGDIKRTMPPKVQAGEIRKYGRVHFPAYFSEITPAEQTIKRHLKSFWNSN